MFTTGPADGHQSATVVDSVPIDGNAGHYQTIICRVPHQYSMVSNYLAIN